VYKTLATKGQKQNKHKKQCLPFLYQHEINTDININQHNTDININ